MSGIVKANVRIGLPKMAVPSQREVELIQNAVFKSSANKSYLIEWRPV